MRPLELDRRHADDDRGADGPLPRDIARRLTVRRRHAPHRRSDPGLRPRLRRASRGRPPRASPSRTIASIASDPPAPTTAPRNASVAAVSGSSGRIAASGPGTAAASMPIPEAGDPQDEEQQRREPAAGAERRDERLDDRGERERGEDREHSSVPGLATLTPRSRSRTMTISTVPPIAMALGATERAEGGEPPPAIVAAPPHGGQDQERAERAQPGGDGHERRREAALGARDRVGARGVDRDRVRSEVADPVPCRLVVGGEAVGRGPEPGREVRDAGRRASRRRRQGRRPVPRRGRRRRRPRPSRR